MNDLKFFINYVSVDPINGDSPKVTISGNKDKYKNEIFKIKFIDFDKKEIAAVKKCKINETVFGDRQWYTKWQINIYNKEGVLLHSELMNFENKTVFIKIDSKSLGDNIAWFPYIEEFRIKNKCVVICSTFYNFLFVKNYKNILFVKPNTEIKNVYAQYYIGVLSGNVKYSPVDFNKVELQKVACEILGIKYKEIKPNIDFDLNENYKEKVVCISEFSSSQKKDWKCVGGWQKLVNYLNDSGYKVKVISKEKTNLNNIIDKTGDIELYDRMRDIKQCSLFIGVSSGLAWLAWALNSKVFLISDVTPSFHEFNNDVIRFGGEKLNEINYSYDRITDSADVINAIKNIL